MSFGAKFKQLLEQKGVTYEDARTALGYKSKGTITNLTKMEYQPSGDKLIRICEYLGVPKTFFDEMPDNMSFNQPENSYKTEKRTIPLMENESPDAVVIAEMVIPQIGAKETFAIEITDDRLSGMGISCGTTLFLTKSFTLSDKHEVIAEQGGKRFFALYEKRGDEEILTPADPGMRRIELGRKNSDIKIYAVVIKKLTSI